MITGLANLRTHTRLHHLLNTSPLNDHVNEQTYVS